MLYAIRQAFDTDGLPDGYYVAMYESDGLPACHQGETFPTVEEADEDFHRLRGCRVDWQEPEASDDGDLVAVARD